MEEFTGQLGERAIGVTNLMAKTLGVTTDVLFKRMEEGKLKPEDMFRLAKAMDAFAKSSDGYKAALANSSSGQERLKNSWALLSYTILNSGLDEALAGIFSGMSDLIEVITPLIKNLIAVAKGFVAVTKNLIWMGSEFKLFTTVILVAFLRKWLVTVAAMSASWLASTVLIIGAAYTTNTALKALLGTVTLLSAALLIPAVIAVWEDLDRYNNNQDNWIRVLIGHFVVAIGYVDVFAASLQYLYAVFTNQPSNFFQELKAVTQGLPIGTGSVKSKAEGTKRQRENLGFTNGDVMSGALFLSSATNNPYSLLYDMYNSKFSNQPSATVNINVTTPTGVTKTTVKDGSTVTIPTAGAANR
jgi:hypothetical protein